MTANKRWLNQTLVRQQDSGCYSVATQQPTYRSHRSSLSTLVLVHKRREKVLRDGCSSHKTSMALASTVVFIRDMISELIDFSFGVRYEKH